MLLRVIYCNLGRNLVKSFSFNSNISEYFIRKTLVNHISATPILNGNTSIIHIYSPGYLLHVLLSLKSKNLPVKENHTIFITTCFDK